MRIVEKATAAAQLIADGNFYEDYDQSSAALGALRSAAALLQQAEAALERSAKAGQCVLEAIDDYNEKHGTYLCGPACFEIGRAVAQNRALLAKLHEGGE